MKENEGGKYGQISYVPLIYTPRAGKRPFYKRTEVFVLGRFPKSRFIIFCRVDSTAVSDQTKPTRASVGFSRGFAFIVG